MDLINYISACLRPRNITELCYNDIFDEVQFNNMVQDAFYILKSRPPRLNNLEFIQVDQYYICRKINRQIAWLKSENEFEWDYTSEPLYRRLLPPPCETVNHQLIISSIIKEYKKEVDYINYIEYGVRNGINLLNVSTNIDKGYGVDISFCDFKIDNVNLYQMTTDKFSEDVLPTLNFNVGFIDADHSSISAFRDFQNMFKYINKNGYIFLHDTYPCEPAYLSPGGCHDCYKTPILIKEKYSENELEILTLPLNPGVTIVRKK